MSSDIATRAAHYPDRTAVLGHTTDERGSYVDLAADAAATADRLRAQHGDTGGNR